MTELSPEQRQVVESWGQGLAVMAGAGSGKTTTLVIKCLELMKQNPKGRFAAVSFTERSAGDLRAKLAVELPAGLESHWVMTIHGLCGAIIREFPREAGFEGDESLLSESESETQWLQALEALWVDDLPAPISSALEKFLARETREGLHGLLKRVKDLVPQGVLGHPSLDSDLRALALFAIERFERIKKRRGAIDFSDLELGADRALEHVRVRETLRKRFDLVMVDEFQDTSPIQARILSRFARQDLSNLCVVGDPKQSIYRFRDADVTVFDEFCVRLPLHLSLTWNFRSRPGIIEFSNRICGPAFEASSLQFEPLVPQRPPRPMEEQVPPVIRLDVRSPADLASWIRGQVAKGIPLEKMALLLRKIRGNEDWLQAISSAGIQLAVGSGGLFWSDPRVRELVAFLKWWDNPGNALSGAIFLRAPWVGVLDTEIDQWVKRDPTLADSFFRSSHPLAGALGLLRTRVVRPGEVLLALLEGPQSLEAELGAPLLGLWHRAEELSSRGLDFHSVVEELALAMEDKRRERDVPPPRNQGQLLVLTLHGSKGLEFEHVILIDFGKAPRTQPAPLLFWDRIDGPFLGVRDADGGRDTSHPEEKKWRKLEAQKELAECKRLFYVALTRARERLVLVCPPVDLSKIKTEAEGVWQTDHWRGWLEQVSADLPRQEGIELDGIRGIQASDATIGLRPTTDRIIDPPRRVDEPRWKRPRHSVTEWNLLSRCPRSYEWTVIRPHIESPMVRVVSTAVPQGITQSELGTRVHACLEQGDWYGLRAIEREVGRDRFNAETIIAWAKDSPLMISTQTGHEGGAREVWTELAFEVGVRSEVIVGSMDRLVYDSGYTLIDFKVTGQAKSVEALLEQYRAQMEIYAWALKRLDPERSLIDAILVNLSASGVREIRVPLGQVDVESLADQAAAIVNGEPGIPRPGPVCDYCAVREQCPEAASARD